MVLILQQRWLHSRNETYRSQHQSGLNENPAANFDFGLVTSMLPMTLRLLAEIMLKKLFFEATHRDPWRFTHYRQFLALIDE